MQRAPYRRRWRNQQQPPFTLGTSSALGILDDLDTIEDPLISGLDTPVMPRPGPEKRAARLKAQKEKHDRRLIAIRKDRQGTTSGDPMGIDQYGLPQQPNHPPAPVPAAMYGQDTNQQQPDPNDAETDDDYDVNDATDIDDQFYEPKMKPMIDVCNDLKRWVSVCFVIDFTKGKAMVMEHLTEELGLRIKTMNKDQKTLQMKCKLGPVKVVGTVDITVRLPNGVPVLLEDCFVLWSKSKAPRNGIFLPLADAIKINNSSQGPSTGRASQATPRNDPSHNPGTNTPGFQQQQPQQQQQPAYPSAPSYPARRDFNFEATRTSTGPMSSASPFYSGANSHYPADPSPFNNAWAVGNFPAGSFGDMSLAIPSHSHNQNYNYNANAGQTPGSQQSYVPSGQDFLPGNPYFGGYQSHQQPPPPTQ